MRKTKKNSKRTKAEENLREKATSQKKERRGRKNKTYEVFLFYFILFFYFQLQSTYLQYLLTYKQYMVLTLLTNYTLLTKQYLFTMWDTYAKNDTILYLQYKTCNTYLQWDTYTTNSAILHGLHIYQKKKKNATCTPYITDYIR